MIHNIKVALSQQQILLWHVQREACQFSTSLLFVLSLTPILKDAYVLIGVVDSFVYCFVSIVIVSKASKQVTVVVIDEVMLQIVRTLFDHVFIARSSPATLIQKFSKFTFCFQHTPASTDNIHTDTLCKYIHKYFVLLWFGFQCDYFCFLSLLFNKKCTKQKKTGH